MRRRRWVAAIALAAYLATIVGVPLPAHVNKFAGVAFPCQHHACGCMSAEQCWNHCCCFSAHERLAWAEENHVAPPAQLLAESAAQDDHDAHCDHRDAAAAPRSCCAHHTASAGHDESAPGQRGAGRRDENAKSSGTVFVLGIMARQCRGLAEFWCLSGAVMPPPSAADWQYQWNFVEWLAIDAVPLWPNVLSPPVPPPRV